MEVTLKQGESLEISLDDSEKKVILIQYTKTKFVIKANLPDSKNRMGDIYNEEFGRNKLKG